MDPGAATFTPAAVRAVLEDGAGWLVERVLELAAQQGYTASTAALREPWRLSVVGLTEAVVQGLEAYDGTPHDYPAAAVTGDDPVAVFVLTEAERHRPRGVTLAMFWGLLKYYRRAYLELLAERLPAAGRWARDVVAECFDRMEFALGLAWADQSGREAADDLARENRWLTNEKDKYLTAFESIPHAMFLLDATGRVENCNAPALALAGYDAPPGRLYYSLDMTGREGACRAVLGCPVRRVLDWLPPQAVVSGEAGQGGPQANVPAVCGERRFAVDVHPMLDVLGALSGRLLVCRDVTDAYLAEQALRQSEERYRTLVDLMHQGLVIFSPEGRIDFANDTLCEMLGAPATAVVGHDAREFVRAEDRSRFATALRARREGGGEPYEMALRRNDGRLTFIMSSPTPLIGEDGEYQGSLEVLTDVSRLKELEMRLVTAKRLEAIGQLAGGVAHEINTPLQYVSGNLEFALSNLPRLAALVEKYEAALALAGEGEAVAAARADIAAYRREHDMDMVLAELPLALAESHAGAERVAAFVRSIKRFAQSESEGRRIIDVVEAITATVEMARSAMHGTATFVVSLDEDLPPLPCVPGDFNQLLLCLLLNAGQAVEEACAGKPAVDGRVHVRARVVEESLEVAISDTGRGIPPEIQDKIFNPFFTTKEVGQGTGQGLSIALSIIQRHQGGIRFETQPGRGTTFYVTFPLH